MLHSEPNIIIKLTTSIEYWRGWNQFTDARTVPSSDDLARRLRDCHLAQVSHATGPLPRINAGRRSGTARRILRLSLSAGSFLGHARSMPHRSSPSTPVAPQ